MIEVWVNGEKRRLEGGSTVSDLMRQLEALRGPVAVELNDAIVRQDHWDKALLSTGDRLEIVHFVGGGES